MKKLTDNQWGVIAMVVIMLGLVFIAWLGFGCAGNTKAKWVETEIPIQVDTLLMPVEILVEVPKPFADPCYFGNEKNPAVYFDTDKAEILPEYRWLLGGIREYMAECENLTLTIVGHADERGSEDYNYKLALERALAVKKWLTDRGIYSGRIAVKSLGESSPVSKESVCDKWQLNRRVELVW